MVRLLPLPWVCQMTPLCRLPPLIQLLNSPNDLLDRKVLLVTADFLHIGVKKNKIADQFSTRFGANREIRSGPAP